MTDGVSSNRWHTTLASLSPRELARQQGHFGHDRGCGHARGLVARGCAHGRAPCQCQHRVLSGRVRVRGLWQHQEQKHRCARGPGQHPRRAGHVQAARVMNQTPEGCRATLGAYAPSGDTSLKRSGCQFSTHTPSNVRRRLSATYACRKQRRTPPSRAPHGLAIGLAPCGR